MIGNFVGDFALPVLPLIDLLLLAGWSSLFTGFVLKAISITTSYQPVILGLSAVDFLLIAIASLLFAIALAARTWVLTQQPAAVAARRSQETLDAWNKLQKDPSESRQPSESEPALSDPH